MNHVETSTDEKEKELYSYIIGELGEKTITVAIQRIAESFNLPWKIDDHDVRSSGADITIRDIYSDEIVAKFEVTNFRISSYYDEKRAKSIKENLQDAPFYGIITSYATTIQYEAGKILESIPVCELGFQILPWAPFEKNNIEPLLQNIPNEILNTAIKRLSEFFHEIKLIPVVYQSIVLPTPPSINIGKQK